MIHFFPLYTYLILCVYDIWFLSCKWQEKILKVNATFQVQNAVFYVLKKFSVCDAVFLKINISPAALQGRPISIFKYKIFYFFYIAEGTDWIKNID